MSKAYGKPRVYELTNDATTEIQFAVPSREVTLTNDSDSIELLFKYKESDDFATLAPTETVSQDVWSDRIILFSSSNAPYRLWVRG